MIIPEGRRHGECQVCGSDKIFVVVDQADGRAAAQLSRIRRRRRGKPARP
jgi:hypothetical protein